MKEFYLSLVKTALIIIVPWKKHSWEDERSGYEEIYSKGWNDYLLKGE